VITVRVEAPAADTEISAGLLALLLECDVKVKTWFLFAPVVTGFAALSQLAAALLRGVDLLDCA
jgi:hypothetical protein